MPSVSVVIRAFNEGQHLGKLLAGLEQQTVRPDEIIVVDSGSTDNTVDIARDAGCRVVTIPKDRFSFGRSLNYGCEAASGDILLIVSAHVYPIHDSYVDHMIRPFAQEKTDIAYGRQVGDHRTKFSESRIMLKWFPEESIWDQGHPFSNNANAAVRRSTWLEYKYNEDLTGLEDLEFAKRVIARGRRVAYVAEAPVVHVHEETWATIQNRYRREAIAYKQIMERSSMPGVKAFGLAAVNIVNDYWHAVRTGCLLQNFTSIPRFRAAQFYGAWEGFRTGGHVSADLLRRFYYPADSFKTAEAGAIGNVIDYSASSNRRSSE